MDMTYVNNTNSYLSNNDDNEILGELDAPCGFMRI